MSIEAKYPNRLRALIKLSGYTVQEVAEETGIPLRSLFDYCAGRAPIPRKRLEVLAQLLGCPVEGIRVNYLDFSRQGEQPNPLAQEITALDSTTSEKLDYAESIMNLAWEAWFASRPKQAAREVTRLLPALENIVHIPLLSAYKLRAQELVLRCHGLLGAICLDALQNDMALFHYMQARCLAEELHDDSLAASYQALIGDVYRRRNEKQRAISLMEAARDDAARLDRSTRGHILQLLAYTYADTGRAPDFERAIDEATDLLAFTGEGRDTAQKEFIPFEIYEIRGKANRDLGKPLEALPFLDLAEEALRAADAVTPRWDALLEISRGQALCDAGDLSEGIKRASQGFLLAYQCQSPRQMNRVRKLLRKLESGASRHESSVKELRELVHETYLRIDPEK